MKKLQRKIDKYKELVKKVQGYDGFIEYKECDSLLFSGLLSCVLGLDNINLLSASDDSGMWHRRSLKYPECYPEFSRSTISRDQLLGLAWGLWVNNRGDVAKQVVKYALRHWLKMGKGKLDRIFISPSLLSTFAWIVYRTGKGNYGWFRWLKYEEGYKDKDGSAAHLQVLHILLRERLEGRISKYNKKVLEYHANRQPRNPLFNYAVGNIDSAMDVLMDESLYPHARLPKRRDRKEQWLPQRDDGADWLPIHDHPNKKHSGGDLLFVGSLILEEF